MHVRKAEGRLGIIALFGMQSLFFAKPGKGAKVMLAKFVVSLMWSA